MSGLLIFLTGCLIAWRWGAMRAWLADARSTYHRWGEPPDDPEDDPEFMRSLRRPEEPGR